MASIKIKSNVSGVIKYFNPRRCSGLVKLDDGSGEVYINGHGSPYSSKFDRGVRVKFSMFFAEDGRQEIKDLRPA
ncbi:MAG: hypothetical protein AAF334_06370 [Pseudomonadota bacterium]